MKSIILFVLITVQTYSFIHVSAQAHSFDLTIPSQLYTDIEQAQQKEVSIHMSDENYHDGRAAPVGISFSGDIQTLETLEPRIKSRGLTMGFALPVGF